MLEPHTASLLVDYYESFLSNQDLDKFRQSVTARYTEGTLSRLLRTGSPQARRAAVLALGVNGSFRVNAAVGRSLRDSDPTVRALAQSALWAIWFRADSPENNAMLEEIQTLIGRERYRDAVKLATRLIDRSPSFAEAYNQRAIAEFAEGKFEESAEDCERALARNPYHIGALAGMGQCYLILGRRAEALKTFKRALEVQPYSADLRERVDLLEAAED
jgi:tetratricopeptide (TPR) repeat protein